MIEICSVRRRCQLRVHAHSFRRLVFPVVEFGVLPHQVLVLATKLLAHPNLVLLKCAAEILPPFLHKFILLVLTGLPHKLEGLPMLVLGFLQLRFKLANPLCTSLSKRTLGFAVLLLSLRVGSVGRELAAWPRPWFDLPSLARDRLAGTLDIRIQRIVRSQRRQGDGVETSGWLDRLQ